MTTSPPTPTQFYFKEITSCLSQAMTEKLQYACEAYIKELVILKTQEDEIGNVEKTYSWLNEVDQQGRPNHINRIIERMFDTSNVPLFSSVISDYFVPEDVPMVRTFVDKYYIYVYNYTQEGCDTLWTHRSNSYSIFHPELYSSLMFEMGMLFYMNLHQPFVINQLYHVIDTDNQLK